MSTKGTIVVIDDSEIVLEQIRAELEPLGYTVKTSTQTVGTARLLVGADLVILDMHMPGLHGGQVLENLRAAEKSATGGRNKKEKKKPPPRGFVGWSAETFAQLCEQPPETLRSQLSISHGTIVALL